MRLCFNCSGLSALYGFHILRPPSYSGLRYLRFPPSRRRILCAGSSFRLPRVMALQEPAERRPDAALTGPNNKPYVLVICGKDSSDNEFAFFLKKKKRLKLAEIEEEMVIHVQSELQSPCSVQTFQTNLYMDNLSTHLFGRSKNVWESPQGCLLFSFTLQMDNGRILPLLQYVVCLAVIEAIKTACEMKGLPCLDVKIKWPNDLYLNGLKVGGVLCTSSYRSKKFDVSAGVGINLDNEMPTTSLNAELQKLTSGIQCLTREEILSSFFPRFECIFQVFSSQGFEALEDLYYQNWMHRD